MEVISIGSSSSGNSYIIKAGSMNLLLDVGLSATKIMKALSECNIEAEDVDAVLVTHEHIDHVRSVRAVARKCKNARFYASRGTQCSTEAFSYVDESRIVTVRRGDSVKYGDVEMKCFGLSHDANEPIGYSIIADGKQLTTVTDTGIVTEEIFDEMCKADKLVFEANHEEDMLMFGPYPYSVKMRIKSDHGHLSNVTSGELLARLLRERAGEGRRIDILLAHLSEKNNTPYHASMTIEEILRNNGFIRDEHYTMAIAAKEGLTAI